MRSKIDVSGQRGQFDEEYEADEFQVPEFGVQSEAGRFIQFRDRRRIMSTRLSQNKSGRVPEYGVQIQTRYIVVQVMDEDHDDDGDSEGGRDDRWIESSQVSEDHDEENRMRWKRR